MSGAFNRNSIANAYSRWAPIYDFVFGKVFDPGRQAAIVAAEQVGTRILEVGIGTGLSLPDYSGRTRITGIDISPAMLAKARDRVRQLKLDNVDGLSVMDAGHLALPDGIFDAVVAQFVITAVPDPEAALNEFVRVTKPGGEIILVNHLGAESGPRWVFEAAFSPLAQRLGWRPEFKFARIANWASRHGSVDLIERRPMPPLGHFSLIRYRKR